jgi:hypothetical protein
MSRTPAKPLFAIRAAFVTVKSGVRAGATNEERRK